jgi:prevent-host-death family protein
MKRWQLQEAKARLSELVRSAQDAPQEITVHGEVTAVVVSHADFERLRGRSGSFVEFMRRSPLAGARLRLERNRSTARRIRL